MKISENKKTEKVLCPEAVDEMSGVLRSFLNENRMESKDVNRYVITAEEILLNHMMADGEGGSAALITGSVLRKPFVILEIEGADENRYNDGDPEMQSVFGNSYLKALGISPEHTYRRGRNRYSFKLKRRSRGLLTYLIIAAAAGILLGYGGILCPDGLRNAVQTFLIEPVYSAFLSILGCIAGPMVFLSVAWGIYGLGDAATLKKTGKNIIIAFLSTQLVSTALTGLLAIPMIGLNMRSGGAGGSGESQVIDMILDIIPKNIISPFADGNMLQIIFLSVILGILMIMFSETGGAVINLVGQINTMVQYLVELVSKCIPIFIFIVIVNMCWTSEMAVVLKIGRYLLMYIVLTAVQLAGLTIYASAVVKVNIVTLVKKCMPVFLTAVTTASSAATFGISNLTCTRKLGLDENITSFGIPLGIVVFKAATALNYLTIVMFFSNMYGMGASVSWYVMTVIIAIIIAVATPPVPGGGMTAYAVLFAQAGIPGEAIAIAIAIDVIVDFISTGADQFLIPLMMLRPAEKLGKLDREVLTSK